MNDSSLPESRFLTEGSNSIDYPISVLETKLFSTEAKEQIKITQEEKEILCFVLRIIRRQYPDCQQARASIFRMFNKYTEEYEAPLANYLKQMKKAFQNCIVK